MCATSKMKKNKWPWTNPFKNEHIYITTYDIHKWDGLKHTYEEIKKFLDEADEKGHKDIKINSNWDSDDYGCLGNFSISFKRFLTQEEIAAEKNSELEKKKKTRERNKKVREETKAKELELLAKLKQKYEKV